jgi:hypothetical protein
MRRRNVVSGHQELSIRENLCVARVFNWFVHPPFWYQSRFRPSNYQVTLVGPCVVRSVTIVVCCWILAK